MSKNNFIGLSQYRVQNRQISEQQKQSHHKSRIRTMKSSTFHQNKFMSQTKESNLHHQRRDNPEQSSNNKMQLLLEEFNKIDHRKQGSIKLSDAIKLTKMHCKLTSKFNDELLSRIIFNVEGHVTFDEFLALVYETELEEGHHTNPANENMVEFLKLLQDYRKKCEEASEYLEAQKAHQKVLQVKNKQMKRHKQKLLSLQKSKVSSVNSLQQSKIIKFNSDWNEYMEKYEQAAMNSIERLKAKHLREMEEEEERIRSYYENYMKPSKKVLDLRMKEKQLVKQREYQQAERIKEYANKLMDKDRQQKSSEINERIQKRKETLQKHQEIALLAHLKRIEKDRNEQMKQRQLDSGKMLIKLKNLQNDLVQKQSVEIKETLDNLRETMCLTSSQLFNKKKMRSMGRLEKASPDMRQSKSPLLPEVPHKTSKEKTGFKIRVNSFHRVKMDHSLYDP